MDRKTAKLLEVFDYSEAMLKDAEAGNWDKVIATEAERSACLTKLFLVSSIEDFTDENENKIRQILNLNEKIESITVDARENIRKDIGSIGKGRKVVELYAQNRG